MVRPALGVPPLVVLSVVRSFAVPPSGSKSSPPSGTNALRALPRIAQSVGQTAARRRLSPVAYRKPSDKPGRVVAQPRLVRQLSRPARE